MLLTSRLTRMRAIVADAMEDTCIIQTYTEGVADSYNEKPITYTDGSAIDCTYEPGGGAEVDRTTGTVSVRRARVKIALTNTVTVKDRIKVTHLKGSELASALVYGVADVRRHTTCIVVDLKDVD